MRLPQISQLVIRRIKHPGYLAAVLAVSSLQILLRLPVLYKQVARVTGLTLMESVGIPLLGMLLIGWLSAIPWQWTGDDRPAPRFRRGLGQSLAFNALVYVPLLYLWWLGLPLVQPAHGFIPTFIGFYILQTVFLAPIACVLGWAIAAWERTRAQKAEAQAEARQSQWILLREQISPHVLFNALNDLAELVHQDPKRAERGLLDLSALYRQLLYHGDHVRVRLGDERQLVERYLKVEALRLDDRLRVTWQWAPELDECQAPPLLLQPLVENALKHGIARHREGGDLHIEGRLEAGRVHLTVGNTGEPLRSGGEPGIGLRNLRTRLHMAYGSAADFQLRHADGWTLAELTFQPDRFQLTP